MTATGAVALQLFLPDQSVFQLWVRRILSDPDANQLMAESFVAYFTHLLPANHHVHSLGQEVIRHRLALLHVLQQTLQLGDVWLELRATGHAILVAPFREA